MARIARLRYGTSTTDPVRLLARLAKKPTALTTLSSSDTTAAGSPWPNAAKHMWTLAHALPQAVLLYRMNRLAQQRGAGT